MRYAYEIEIAFDHVSTQARTICIGMGGAIVYREAAIRASCSRRSAADRHHLERTDRYIFEKQG